MTDYAAGDKALVSHGPVGSAPGVEAGANAAIGTQQLRALLSQGRPPPSVVAKLVIARPGEQPAMFTLLHTTLGNSYVQEVLAAINILEATKPARPDDPKQLKSTSGPPGEHSLGSMAAPDYNGQRASDTGKPEPTAASAASDDRGLDFWDVVSIGTGGGGAAGRELMKHSSQFIQDLVASINQSPRHFANELLALYKMHPDELLSFMQVAEGLLAAEVISGALLVAPDPTEATKVVAVLLQLILVAFAVHVAISEGPAAIAAGREWLRLCHAANGDAAAVDQAATAFASCVFHLIQAIQAVVGGVAAVGDGIRVAGRDVPVADESEFVARDLAERQKQAREQKATREQSERAREKARKLPANEPTPTPMTARPESLEETTEYYANIYEGKGIGPELKAAAEIAKNPNTIYHHNTFKGGTRAIVKSSEFKGGAGTASFGGEESVRAWFGPSNPGPRTAPTIEFRVPGAVPDVRPFMGTPGAKWNVDVLDVHIERIHLPDGRIAVPRGDGTFTVTSLDGAVTTTGIEGIPE
jgi:hypothetical protein